MADAEAETDEPAEQLVAFVRHFEQVAAELAPTQPGCLFVSFIYESQLPGDGTGDLIAGSIRDWRERLLEKLEAAARAHPPATAVDLPSLADHVFTVFEGGFILARAMDEPAHLPAQLAHVRHYLQLLFGLSPGQPTPPAARGHRLEHHAPPQPRRTPPGDAEHTTKAEQAGNQHPALTCNVR